MKQFFQKYKAEIFVGTSALLAGVLSFFITLNVYPKAKVQVPVKKAEEQIAREESEMIKNEGGTELLEVEKKNEEEPEIVIVLGEPKKDSKIEDEEEQSKELYNETDEEEGLIEAEIIEESEEIKIARENSEEKVDMCLKHIDYLSKIKPEKLVCLEIRNHVAWYLKGLKNSNVIKEKIFKANKVCDIINLLNAFKEEYNEN